MDNNQNANNQTNQDIPNLENMNNQTPIQNSDTPMESNQTVNNQINFDPYTGQPINQNQTPNQVPAQNNVNNQVAYGTPKKSNGAFIAIVIVLAIIIVGLIAYIAFGDSIKSLFTGKEDPDIVEKGNGTNVVNTSGPTISVNGYVFQVPQGFEVDNSSTYGRLIDNTNRIIVVPFVSPNVTYADLVNKVVSVKQLLESKGVTVTNYEEKSFGGRQWLVFDYTKNGAAAQYAFTSIDATTVFEMDYYNQGKILSDDQIYSVVNQMISTGKRSDGSSFSPDETHEITITDFSKVKFK